MYLHPVILQDLAAAHRRDMLRRADSERLWRRRARVRIHPTERTRRAPPLRARLSRAGLFRSRQPF
jgi:hypothetical protein